MNREQTQWLQHGLEYLAEDILDCCGRDNEDRCETCGFRLGALAMLTTTGDFDAENTPGFEGWTVGEVRSLLQSIKGVH